MPRALKVYRMPIGFEDAYVAAPSRAAALRAWGATHDQFARGNAEEVTDPALMKEPLARPGEVVRKSRGDLAKQLKALPKQHPAKPAARSEPKPAKPKPPPKRDKIDAAEAALQQARARQEAELAALEAQLEATRAKQRVELDKLTRKRDAERTRYRAKLDALTGEG